MISKIVCSVVCVLCVVLALGGVVAALDTQSRLDAILAKPGEGSFAQVFVMMIATSRLHYLWTFTWGAATVAAVLLSGLMIGEALRRP